jgi:hypothetical protein
MRSVRVDTPTTARLKAARKQRRRQEYVGGTFRLSWLAKANRAHVHGLALALLIKRQIDLEGEEPVTLSEETYDHLGVSRQSRYRALQGLEDAGMVRVERGHGRLPRIWLLEPPDNRED